MAGPWEKFKPAAQDSAGSGPWSKFQSQVVAEEPKSTAPKPAGTEGRTALEQFANAVTFGHLPELQAAVSKIMPNPSYFVDQDLKAKKFKIQEGPESYESTRDQNRSRQAQDAKENPNAALAGKLGGLAALTALSPTSTASTLLGKVAQGAGTGGVIGALQNPGEDGSRLQNAATGALTGGAVQSLAGPLAAVAGRAGLSLSSPGAIEKARTIGGELGRYAGTGAGFGIGGMPGALLGEVVKNQTRKAGAALGEATIKGVSKLAQSTPAIAAFASQNPMRFQVLMSQISAPEVATPEKGQEYALLKDPEAISLFKTNPALIDQVKDDSLRGAIIAKLGGGL